MTFQEIATSLPNGFHDAELLRFEMNYAQGVLHLDLVVWIGDMAGPPGHREFYRPARVTVNNVGFLVVEPPDANYPRLKAGPITIDAGEGQPRQSSSSLPSIPAETELTWVYMGELNRFLFFAGGEASLQWVGPEENRG